MMQALLYPNDHSEPPTDDEVRVANLLTYLLASAKALQRLSGVGSTLAKAEVGQKAAVRQGAQIMHDLLEDLVTLVGQDGTQMEADVYELGRSLGYTITLHRVSPEARA